MTEIRADLKPYVPASLYDGETLKAGVTAEQATQIAEGIRAAVKDLPEAQAQFVLKLLSAVDLAPGGRLPENIDEAVQAFAGALERIGEGTPFRDSLQVLARLMIEQAATNRQDALQDRLNARNLSTTQLLSQAQSSKDAAKEIKDGAVAAMVTAIVFAAVSIVASSLSIVGGVKSGSDAANYAANNAGKMDGFVASGFAASSQATQGLSQTAGQVGQAGSGYASSDSQAAVKELDAQGQIAAAQAQASQNQADLSKEFMDAMGEAIKQIMNFLKELHDAKAQSMQVLTRT